VKQSRGKPLKKTRDWIKDKKERRRQQGKDVKSDSKFTGRKRKTKF
jgi:18S rRNA (guanine1575-N7)-methyltransferase